MPPDCNQFSKLSALVNRAFEMVGGSEKMWAREYLLTHSTAKVLRLFSNPGKVGQSFVSRSIDTVQELSPGTAPVEAEGKHSFDAVLVPEFNTQGLCIGGVACRFTRVAPMNESRESVSDSRNLISIDALSLLCTKFSDLSTHPHFCSIGRFVRNEANGDILIVMHSDDPPSIGIGHTQVLYVEQVSTTRRLRTYFLCDSQLFTQGDFAGSVTKYYAHEDWRFCPACRSSPAANCCCRMSQRDQAYDFNVFGSVEKFVSDYMGIADVTMAYETSYFDSVCDHSNLPIAESSVSSGGLEYQSRITNTYLRYLSARCVSNVHTKRSFSGNRDVCHDDIASSLLSLAVQSILGQRSIVGEIVPSSGHCGLIANGRDPHDQHHALSVRFANHVSSDWDLRVESESDAPTQSDAMLTRNISSLNFYAGHGAGTSASENPSSALSSLESHTIVDTSDDLLRKGLAHHLPSTGTARESLPHASTNVGVLWSDVVDDGFKTPLPTSQPGRGKRRRRSRVFDDDQELVSAKEMQRRLRNRESAARANAKKKAFVDGLKRGIKDAKDLAASLSAKQIELVKENMALRRQVLGHM